MLEILTPLSKVHRVSRVIDPANFTAEPGVWAEVQSDGSLANITESSPTQLNKMVITSASDNIYESHDVEVGRISTVEDHGIRCKVDSVGFHGTISQGDDLYVSSEVGEAGKLTNAAGITETGDHELVAKAEVVGTDYIIFRTLSPTIVTDP